MLGGWLTALELPAAPWRRGTNASANGMAERAAGGIFMAVCGGAVAWRLLRGSRFFKFYAHHLSRMVLLSLLRSLVRLFGMLGDHGSVALHLAGRLWVRTLFLFSIAAFTVWTLPYSRFVTMRVGSWFLERTTFCVGDERLHRLLAMMFCFTGHCSLPFLDVLVLPSCLRCVGSPARPNTYYLPSVLSRSGLCPACSLHSAFFLLPACPIATLQAAFPYFAFYALSFLLPYLFLLQWTSTCLAVAVQFLFPAVPFPPRPCAGLYLYAVHYLLSVATLDARWHL